MGETDAELLARIDERTTLLVDEMHSIKRTLENKYVTQEEFRPIKLLTYGVVAIICSAFFAGLLGLVLVRGH